MIRRIPEVGEYATFTFRAVPDPNRPGKLAEDGELVLKCVGSAEIDGRQYLWIEIDETSRAFSPAGQPGRDRNHITKVLVAEDTLLSHDCEIARGWVRFDEDEPHEVTGGLASELASGTFYMAVRQDIGTTLVGIEDEESIESPIEISVAGETLSLTSAVMGTTTSLTIEPNTQGVIERHHRNRTSIWWLEEDLAFGVAAWESTVVGSDGVEGDAPG